MLCKKCGAQIDDNALECEFCGENLAETPFEEEIEQSAPIEEQRSTHEIFEENKQRRKIQTEKIIDERQQQLDEINARRELKKKREQRKKVILIVVICAIIAAAAGVGAYLLKDSIKPNVKPVPTQTPVATIAPTPVVTSTPEVVEATIAPTPVNNVSTQQAPVATQSSNNTTTVAPAKPAPTPATSNTQSANKPSRKGTGASGYKTASATSGVSTAKISSSLAVGGIIEFDDNTQRPIMSFEINNKTYYAYVSVGSVTSQINGKYMTVAADPTEQTYKGSTIYDITSLTYYDADGYVIPESGIRMLTKSELSGLSKKELAIARNEIYARHGRTFKIKEYSDYFKSKSWYRENPKYNYSNEAANLNEFELKNAYLILSLEN